MTFRNGGRLGVGFSGGRLGVVNTFAGNKTLWGAEVLEPALRMKSLASSRHNATDELIYVGAHGVKFDSIEPVGNFNSSGNRGSSKKLSEASGKEGK